MRRSARSWVTIRSASTASRWSRPSRPDMYQLLEGIRVLEVSLLAPDMLGMHLADLGAEVVKIEAPPDGDHLRLIGGPFRGGASWLHRRWNRSKQSLALDLKVPEGRAIFLELARSSQVVVDGLRLGAMSRLALDFENVKAVNPSVVYCSLS